MEKKPNISPEDYRKCLQGLDLVSIFIDSCSFNVNRALLDKEMDIHTQDKSKYKLIDDEIIDFEQTYELSVNKRGEKEHAVKLKCKYVIRFKYKCKASKDFFDIYKDINLSLNTWPYFREYVATIFAKAALPPLTLPLLKK